MPTKDVNFQLLKAYMAVADDPIPYDPGTLRAIVKSLLQRIKAQTSKEGRAVANCVHLLAAIERFSPKAAFSTESPLIEFLARPLGEHHQHWNGIVQWQRDWLIDYIRTEKFPFKGSSSERRKWFQRHHQTIWKEIIRIPCVCEYSPSLEAAGDYVETHTGETQLVITLLSVLHGLEPTANPYDGQIYKLLTSPD